MKNMIILLFLISAIGIKAQTYYPKQKKFLIYPTLTSTVRDSMYITTDSSRFKMDNEFRLGWHWGGGPAMSKALLMNQIHSAGFPNFNYKYPESIVPNSSMVHYIQTVSSNGSNQSPAQAMGLMFEPTLLIDSTKYEEVQTRADDPTRPIFGFIDIKGEAISTNPADADYSRLKLLRAGSSYISSSVPILSKNYVNNGL